MFQPRAKMLLAGLLIREKTPDVEVLEPGVFESQEIHQLWYQLLIETEMRSLILAGAGGGGIVDSAQDPRLAWGGGGAVLQELPCRGSQCDGFQLRARAEIQELELRGQLSQ